MSADRMQVERQSHARRVEALQRRLEKLKRDIVDVEIQLENERLIADNIAVKTRKFGVLAMLDESSDEGTTVSTHEEEVDTADEPSESAEAYDVDRELSPA